MKKIALLFVLFSVFSCGDNAVDKPENLIEKEVMVDILSDLTIIQSVETNNPGVITQKEIKVNEVIYKRYNIDSVSFAQSNRYYASNPHEYQKIIKKVSEKIAAKKEVLNQQSMKETGKSIAPSDAPAIQ